MMIYKLSTGDEVHKYQKSIVIIFKDGRIGNYLKPEFIHNLHSIDGNRELVTLTSLYVHLLDQLDWGLLSNEEVVDEGSFILSRIYEKFNISEIITTESKLYKKSKDEIIETMSGKLIFIIAKICGGMMHV